MNQLPIAHKYRIENINITSTPTLLATLLDLESQKVVQVNITPSADITIKDIYTSATLTVASGITKIIPAWNPTEHLQVYTATTATATVELFYEA